MDGAARQISCGKDGTVLCVNAGQQIYKRSGANGHWEQLDGAAVQGDIWDHNTFAVVNAGNEIYTRRYFYFSFCPLFRLSLFFASSSSHYLHLRHGAWVREPGHCRHISLGANSYERLVCANSGHEIYTHHS